MDKLIDIIKGKNAVGEVQARFLKYYSSLSENVRNRVENLEVLDILESNPEFKPLQAHQKTIVENNIYLALLGLVEVMDFVTAIKIEAEISRDRAEKIMHTIDLEIFTPQRDVMEDVFDYAGETNKKTNTFSTIKRPPVVMPKKPNPVQNVEQKIKKEQTDSLDIFKKRLTSPVHATIKEENIVTQSNRDGERVANTSPSSEEQIARDPYKETIE